MEINVYKIKRGSYKIIVFSKHGLETYLIKGRKEMKTKVTLLKKIDRKKGSFDLLPRPYKVMKGGSVHAQFTNEEQQLAALKFCQRTDPLNREKYTTKKE